jgi:hypothetical protein
MKAITIAMIVYCAGFAVLIFAISAYRWLKRGQEMQLTDAGSSTASGDRTEVSTAPNPHDDSPQHVSHTKHAA